MWGHGPAFVPLRCGGRAVRAAARGISRGTASPELAIVRKGEVRYRKAPFPVHDVGFEPDRRLWLTSGEETSIWDHVFTPSLDAGTLAVLDGPMIKVARSSHDACLMHA